MRKYILSLIIVVAILLIVASLGAKMDSWQYWTIVFLLGCYGSNLVTP